MASYLVSGASRGIGLGICTILAAKPASEVSVVFAAARTKTSELQALEASSAGRVKIISVEVTSSDAVKMAADEVEKALSPSGLDVLVNVAGINDLTPGPVSQIDPDALESVFQVNVTAVHRMTSAFLPLLRKGNLKKIINLSTTVGSIGMAANFRVLPTPAYKITKAALNMLTVQYSLALEEEGFSVFAVSPGWVRTDFGGCETADLDANTAAQAILDIVFKAEKSYNGKFFNIHVPGLENNPGLNQYDGKEVVW